VLVPYRRPKRPYVLPVVTTLAVAAPLVTLVLRDSADYRSTNDSNPVAIPAQFAEVALDSAPDLVLPLPELTGLNLPDLHLSDLRTLPLPRTLPVPQGLPAPPGVQLPSEIPLPQFDRSQQRTAVPPAPAGGTGFIAAPGPVDDPALVPGADPGTPALVPGAVAPDVADRVGAQVKVLTRDVPFSLVALTGTDLAGTTALIRSQNADGSWGPWYPTDRVDTRRNDHVTAGKIGTEPIYVGRTEAVQVLVTRDAAAPGPADSAAGKSGDPAQLPAPALSAVLIDPGRGAADEDLSGIAAPLPGSGPKVISRAQWGADESLRCEDPTYDDGVSAITVHHTAGRNDYARNESPAIVRAIYAYHAKTLGWCDIGYNALVDKYGQIFEGRYGGLDRPVEGAHAGGFNENTAGVALMGNYESEPPSDAAIQAIGQFIGWRAKMAGLDPKGTTTLYSEGTEYTRYDEGEAVQLPIVFAHRDVGNTTCPGDAAYALMDRIRDLAANAAGPIRGGAAQNAGYLPGGDSARHDSPSAVPPQPNAAPRTTIAPRSPQTQRTEADIQAMTDLTNQLLSLVNDNIIAKYWAAQGGPDGRLGAATAEPRPTRDGGQYAKFVNGYVYATPTGDVIEVTGHILDRFVQLGAETGLLGLPVRNAYPVPDGLRADFQYGALVLNSATDIVTTLLNSYGDGRPATGQAIPDGGPAPEPAPIP
jgi:uncharacterized protein with LGFP repeats